MTAVDPPLATAENGRVMLVVRLDTRDGAQRQMSDALTRLTDATRREDRGVIGFEVGLDPLDDTRVVGYEIWESKGRTGRALGKTPHTGRPGKGARPRHSSTWARLWQDRTGVDRPDSRSLQPSPSPFAPWRSSRPCPRVRGPTPARRVRGSSDSIRSPICPSSLCADANASTSTGSTTRFPRHPRARSGGGGRVPTDLRTARGDGIGFLSATAPSTVRSHTTRDTPLNRSPHRLSPSEASTSSEAPSLRICVTRPAASRPRSLTAAGTTSAKNGRANSPTCSSHSSANTPRPSRRVNFKIGQFDRLDIESW
jgi:quinol monooxygenase YgiN